MAAEITELSTIILYQHEMIFCYPEGGVVTLCLHIQDANSTHLVLKDHDRVHELHLMTLKDLLGSA